MLLGRMSMALVPARRSQRCPLMRREKIWLTLRISSARNNPSWPATSAGMTEKADCVALIPLRPRRVIISAVAIIRMTASTPIHRLRLREETREDVVDEHVILLLEARVRDAGHNGELLVRVRQFLEKLQQVLQRGNAIVLAAHDERRHRDLFRVNDRQLRAHVDIGSRRN